MVWPHTNSQAVLIVRIHSLGCRGRHHAIGQQIEAQQRELNDVKVANVDG